MSFRTIRAFLIWSALSLGAPSAVGAEFNRYTYKRALVHWDVETVHMPVDPRLGEIYGAQIYDVLAEAVDAWACAPNVPRIELAYGGTEDERRRGLEETGNFIGVITEDWPFGNQLAITISNMGADSGRLRTTQVWLNAARPLSLGPNGDNQAYDLRGVIYHELGHVLGLGEAHHAPHAVMHPRFRRGEVRVAGLTKEDEAAITSLYDRFQRDEAPTGCTAGPALLAAPRCLRLLWPLALLAVCACYRRTKRRLAGRLRRDVRRARSPKARPVLASSWAAPKWLRRADRARVSASDAHARRGGSHAVREADASRLRRRGTLGSTGDAEPRPARLGRDRRWLHR